LKPESPAFKLGFQPIPVAKIGPYADSGRASWPVVEDSVASQKAKPIVRAYDIYPSVKPQRIAGRDGIPGTMAKLKAGETVRIAYFGGGIHSAGGWRKLYLDGLRKAYPNATIEEIDAGVCDCVRGSGFSHWRYEHDVLAHKPDLVLVDFASDDASTPPPAIQRAIEGVVRKTYRLSPAPELLFFYAFRDGFETAYKSGKCPTTVTAYELLAEQYGIPSVNPGVDIATLIADGKMVAKGKDNAFSADGVRPGGTANQLYADALSAAFAQLASITSPRDTELPEPLVVDNYENAHQIPVTQDMLKGAWTRLGSDDPMVKRVGRQFDEIWVTREPAATLTFSFVGTQAGMTMLIGPDIGRFRVSVDGKETSTQGHADRWCYYHRLSAPGLASGLAPGKHTITVELLPDPPDRSEPIAEAKRLDKYEAKDFEGVALMIGNLRVLTDKTK
jgi:hypothetical protein